MKAPEVKPAPEVKMAAARPNEPQCDAALTSPAPRMGKNFRKPVEGAIIGPFGPQRDGSVNEGVTYSVPKGTPIKAAENGVVAYVGDELPGIRQPGPDPACRGIRYGLRPRGRDPR